MVPRWTIGRRDPDMRVADHVIGCAVAVGYQPKGGEFVAYGSGFPFFIDLRTITFAYIVTARHVIESIPGDWITIRGIGKSGEAVTAKFRRDSITFHPDHESPDAGSLFLDVAVIPFNGVDPRNKPFGVTHVEEVDLLTPEIMHTENIGVGDEVVTVGMFLNYIGYEKHTPVVRIGNIAAIPPEPVPTQYGFMDAHLVETRSISGLSGSPVFLHMGLRPSVQRNGPLPLEKRTHYLLGLMHGYFLAKDPLEIVDSDSGKDVMNAGIGVVVPAGRIREALYHPLLVEERERWVEHYFRDAKTRS